MKSYAQKVLANLPSTIAWMLGSMGVTLVLAIAFLRWTISPAVFYREGAISALYEGCLLSEALAKHRDRVGELPEELAELEPDYPSSRSRSIPELRNPALKGPAGFEYNRGRDPIAVSLFVLENPNSEARFRVVVRRDLSVDLSDDGK